MNTSKIRIALLLGGVLALGCDENRNAKTVKDNPRGQPRDPAEPNLPGAGRVDSAQPGANQPNQPPTFDTPMTPRDTTRDTAGGSVPGTPPGGASDTAGGSPGGGGAGNAGQTGNATRKPDDNDTRPSPTPSPSPTPTDTSPR